MMTTIAIAMQKGGVAKTTTAHALGIGLANKGYKVLFVDLDPQGNLTYALGGDPNLPNMANLLNQQLETGKCDPHEAIQHTAQSGTDLIACDMKLAGADEILAESIGKEYRVKDILTQLSKDYDYCVIDTAPNLGILTVNALTSCNDIIAPTQADIFNLTSLSQLVTTIQAVQKYCNKYLIFRGVLLTRFSPRAVLSRDIKEKIAELTGRLGTKLFDTSIRECNALREAQLLQQDIYSYSPRCNGSKDYKAFVEEYLRGV